MGIVYRARDIKLDRTVAIKVLPSAALSSEDDRARFYREPTRQQHSPIHTSPSSMLWMRPFLRAPPRYRAQSVHRLEFIDGETLEERVKQGPLKLKDAVRLGAQMAVYDAYADGLNARHRSVHESGAGDSSVWRPNGYALPVTGRPLTKLISLPRAQFGNNSPRATSIHFYFTMPETENDIWVLNLGNE